ncbi:MAG: efflux RND transporter permease subunit [Cyanobium sp. CZS 25K]|nr:efflux RND transporter permease subunit [Cyanobium sp. CZS25K]
MSATGLVIALGLLIDNAIVVVDEVQQRLRTGAATGEAVRQSVGYLLVPILMTATLVLSFRSFRMAVLIASVALLSVGLAALALKLSGSVFGFTAILGTLGLIGLAINDSIVVLNAIRTDPLAAVGDPAATTAVVLHATRHVIATTLTTVTGFLPLMLDPTGFWPPLAIAVSGGLVGATALPCCPLHRPPWNDQHG